MACFIAPMSLAVVTTVFRKKVPEALHVEWLNIMIWGGAIMLAVEHIAHGEIILYPPFLTAMQTPAEIPVMLQEMAVVGGSMMIAIVCVWIFMVYVSQRLSVRQEKTIQS